MYINLDIFLPTYWVFWLIGKGNKMFNGAFKIVNAFFNGLSNYRFIYCMDSCLPFRLNCKEHSHLYLDLQWYISVDNLLPQSLWPVCLASSLSDLYSQTLSMMMHSSFNSREREKKLSLVKIVVFFIVLFYTTTYWIYRRLHKSYFLFTFYWLF